MTKKLTEVEFERLERGHALKALRARELELCKLREEKIKERENFLKASLSLLQVERQDVAKNRNQVIAAIKSDEESNNAVKKAICERLKISEPLQYDEDTLEVFDSNVEELKK